MAMKKPTIKRIRSLLTHDPDAGTLHWKSIDTLPPGQRPQWIGKHAGKQAFTAINADGYYKGSVDGVHISLHVVIWALHYGMWHKQQIDHINGVRKDNRICNLRQVSRTENQQNMKLRIDNKTGVAGVIYDTVTDRYRVSAGKTYRAYFKTLLEAETAVKAARKRMGFHPNHGLARD